MLFDNIRKGFSKTKQSINDKLSFVFSASIKIDESIVDELEEILILSDVGVNASSKLCNNLKQRIKKDKINSKEKVVEALKEEMIVLLENEKAVIDTSKPPSIILIVGVNGVGKTTSIGKLANTLKKEGKKVLLVAGDTFRAGAVEQLDIWANRVGCDIVKSNEGTDPASVIFDGIKKAKDENYDVILCDTAGRLHNKKHLMDELAKIKRIIVREMPESSKEVLMVIDSTTGQNAISQAKIFAENTDVTGIILTKLDGTAKGGIIFSIVTDMNFPVLYIGIGEQIEDFKEFNAKEFVDSIL